jgi:cell division protein FtsB
MKCDLGELSLGGRFMTGRVIVIWLALAISFGTVNTALAQDQAAAIEELRKEMKELHQEVSAKDKKIEALGTGLKSIPCQGRGPRPS